MSVTVDPTSVVNSAIVNGIIVEAAAMVLLVVVIFAVAGEDSSVLSIFKGAVVVEYEDVCGTIALPMVESSIFVDINTAVEEPVLVDIPKAGDESLVARYGVVIKLIVEAAVADDVPMFVAKFAQLEAAKVIIESTDEAVSVVAAIVVPSEMAACVLLETVVARLKKMFVAEIRLVGALTVVVIAIDESSTFVDTNCADVRTFVGISEVDWFGAFAEDVVSFVTKLMVLEEAIGFLDGVEVEIVVRQFDEEVSVFDAVVVVLESLAAVALKNVAVKLEKKLVRVGVGTFIVVVSAIDEVAELPPGSLVVVAVLEMSAVADTVDVVSVVDDGIYFEVDIKTVVLGAILLLLAMPLVVALLVSSELLLVLLQLLIVPDVVEVEVDVVVRHSIGSGVGAKNTK